MFQISRLPGAEHCPPDADQQHLKKVLNAAKDSNKQKIACYCSLGYRSSKVADQLNKLCESEPDCKGKINAYNIEGSIFKWANEGRTVIDKDGNETKLVHPYNSVFGKFLDADRRADVKD